jgi:lipopolysaccharide transport system permease protein
MLYSLNPLVGIIDLFRWSVTGSALYVPSVIISAAVILFLLALGVWYFRRTEKTFADII